ncbi:MAG: hypothetical protein JWO36_7024 [Myxococcales bacterium]|nr:hypothetical protein [Myxococcales bacterium]
MGRLSILCILLVACGGVQVPEHNGYKSDKAKPWKKAKTLKFDDKNEAKSEGDLSYLAMKRAAWFAVDVTTPAALDLRLEVTPPGDGVNEDFDLAMEVLDPGYRVVSKADLEEEDAHELNKTRSLVDLAPGRYLIHLYLQGRLDTADYILHAVLKPTSGSVGKSDFPAQVAFPSPLAMVPLNDDTPKTYKPVVVATTPKPIHHKTPTTPPVVKDATPPATTLSARIIGMSVVSGGTQITIGRGTSNGAAVGMKGKVTGVSTGSFTLGSCNERACTATVSATPDQVKGAGSVTLGP